MPVISDKEKQLKNSFIYLILQGINSVLPIIAISIFTRILTREDYGVLALVQAYAIFASGLANFGMLPAYSRNYFQYRMDKVKLAQLLYSTLGFVIFTSFIFGFLTYFLRSEIAEFIVGSTEYGNLIVLAFCSQSLYGFIFYYLTYFKNSENAIEYGKYIIAFTSLNFFFALLFVGFFRVGVIGLIYAHLLAGIIVFCFVSLIMIKKLSPAFSTKILRESILLGYPLTPRIFLGVINSQFDKYMIGVFATLGAVGIYGVGQRLANGAFAFVTAIQNVFFPQVYKKMFDYGENGGEEVGRYLTPFAYICLLPAFFIALFAEEIISVITPPEFHGAIPIVTILALFYGCLFFGKQPQLVYAKKTYITSLLSFVSVGMNIGINIPFILRWGAIGAAWATLLAGLLSGILSFIVSQHYYRIGWEYKKIGAMYSIFFCGALTVLFLHHFFIGYEARLLVKILFLSFYLLLGVKLRVLTKDNFQFIVKMIRSKINKGG